MEEVNKGDTLRAAYRRWLTETTEGRRERREAAQRLTDLKAKWERKGQ